MRYDGLSLLPFKDATLSDNIDIADGVLNPLSQSASDSGVLSFIMTKPIKALLRKWMITNF